MVRLVLSNRNTSAPREATGLFDSLDEELEYLEELDMDVTKASLLESIGRKREAAEVHLSEGRIMDAAKLFFDDDCEVECVELGVRCVL